MHTYGGQDAVASMRPHTQGQELSSQAVAEITAPREVTVEKAREGPHDVGAKVEAVQAAVTRRLQARRKEAVTGPADGSAAAIKADSSVRRYGLPHRALPTWVFMLVVAVEDASPCCLHTL